jgi:ABC-type nitrate/sulfonate/bicarbonate transport system substrate-binding protein
MIRTATIAFIGGLCVLAGTVSGPAFAQDKKFVIAAPGIPPVFASAILYVADKEGFFKKHNVNAEVRPFETGATASRAVISGDIEMSLSPTALLISQVSNTNAPVVAIYGLANSDFILGSTDPTKTNCKDVVGQGVGVDAIGGARSIALRTMLTRGCQGVKLEDVQQTPLSSNVAPALVAGQLKFGVLHLDDVATIELKENRDLYVRAMAALIEAARFIRDPKNADRVGEDSVPTGHSKEVSKATIKPLLDIDYWTADNNGLDQKRLENMIALVQRVGGIQPGKEPAKFDRLADPSVFRDAAAMADAAK